jgi:hypothetical protein
VRGDGFRLGKQVSSNRYAQHVPLVRKGKT